MNALTKFKRYAAASLGVSRKEAARVTGSVRIGGSGSSGYLGDWLTGDNPSKLGRGSIRQGAVWIPGTNINWDAVTGEILSCPASMACINWVWRNRPQAPPITEEVDEDGQWEEVADHGVTQLLKRPNPFYDGETLLNMAYFSLVTNGNAYLPLELTNGGDIAAAYWWPHNMVEIPADHDGPIQSYILTDFTGRRKEWPAEEVWHLKWGLDPDDFRFGMSPAGAMKRDVYTLQKAVNYRANILRNFGAVGTIISAKNDTWHDEAAPGLIKDMWRDKTRGDNVGDVLVLDVPADVHFPGVSPEKMALDLMEDRPEANICALFGLPPQVVGLHVGRLAKTYANYAEARESAWEEGVMPINNLFACQIGYRLDGQTVVNYKTGARTPFTDANRIGFDYSEVRPLQPDLDKLNAREILVFEKDGQTLGEFCKNTKRPEPRAELRDLYYSEMKSAMSPAPAAPNSQNAPGADQMPGGGAMNDNMDNLDEEMDMEEEGGKALTLERLDWAERVVQEIEARANLKAAIARNGHA